MRKLWLRFYLWNNHICPKHGPMNYGVGGHYCFDCDADYRLEKLEKFDAYRKELNAVQN